MLTMLCYMNVGAFNLSRVAATLEGDLYIEMQIYKSKIMILQ